MATNDPMARAEARRLIRDLQIRRASEIQVDLIAAHLGFLVEPRTLQHEEGRLVRIGRGGLIVVSDTAYGTPKGRFIVAHEIGHAVRHRSLDQLALCSSRDLATAYGRSGREWEANEFAAAFLMPDVLFEPLCQMGKPSMKHVRELAQEFGTSLTATALRFVECSPEPCAVVGSVDGKVEWVKWNDDFKIGIRTKVPLTKATYAYDLHAGLTVYDFMQSVDSMAWSDSSWAERYDLHEHSTRTSARSVLSLMWHPAL